MIFPSRSAVLRSLWLGVLLALAATPSATAKSNPPSRAAKSKSGPPRPSAPAPIPDAIAELGPLSVGHPHAGYLVNGVKMPASEHWVLTVPSHGYGTQETVESLGLCIRRVREEIPGSHKVMLGSLSAQRGGHLPPHKSHRTGRDADVYFFRHEGAQWSRAATQEDIDLKRTWTLLRCFITETDVEMILIDKKVQGWLEAYALARGEPPEWISELFHDRKGYKSAVIRHVPGHVAHMHVRFVSATARRKAVRHYDRLVANGVVVPPVQAVTHRVVKGDTLSGLARDYRTTVHDIQELNQLPSTLIRIGQKLTLQQAVDIRGAKDPVIVPPRHLPPFHEPTSPEKSQETRLPEPVQPRPSAPERTRDSST